MKRVTKLLTTILTVMMLFTSAVKINAEWYDYDDAFVYIEDATCQRETAYEIYDEEGNVYLKYEKEYNDLGLCIKETYFEANDNNELVENEQVIFEYDETGKILKWEFFTYQDEKAILKQTKNYEYNGNSGKETTILHEEDRDIVVEETEIKYDGQGREISRINKVLNTEEVFEISFIRYTSYEDNKVRIESYYYTDGELYDGFLQINTFDDQERTIYLEEVYYNLETEQFDQEPMKTEYSYDKNGKSIITAFYEDGKTSERVKYDTVVNDKNLIVEDSTIINFDDDDHMGVKTIYEYDENDNPIKMVYYDYNENKEWEIEGEGTVQYDSRGLMVEEYDKYNYDDYTEESTTKHTYELIHLDLEEVKEEGYKVYYYCNECGKYYSDNKGQNIIYDLDAWKQNNKESKYGTFDFVLLGVSIAAFAGVIIYKKKRS